VQLITIDVEVPQARGVYETTEVIGTGLDTPPRVPRHDWFAPEPDGGFLLFALRKMEKGKPEPVTCAAAVEHARHGVPLADRDAALQAIEDIGRRAQYGPARLARYEAVVAAADEHARKAARQRALEKLGMAAGDDFDPNAVTLVTRADVAAILNVSERTVDRWNGTVLPRALKLGSRVAWRADAILGYLERAA
jgi:hypothetical protein